MSHMSQKDINERNQSPRYQPNWCVNCKKGIPDEMQFCSDECVAEWDKKMEAWRRDLQIENLICDPKDICEPIGE